MHRSAQRNQQHQRAGRPGGRGRGRRLLAGAAAVPVLLLAAACSSDSGTDSGSGGDAKEQQSPSASASATPSASAVPAAAYAELPDACSALAKKTLEDLVPEGATSGKAINEGEPDASGDCRWTSLEDNGVKGSQYRWLSVSLLRLESDEARGAGDERAAQQYEKKVTEAQSVDGAKNVKSEAAGGIGDQATLVRYDLKKEDAAFKQQTVVVRTENVVVTLDYNGAGLAGDATPDADDLVKSAKAAAKEVVAAVAAANKGGSASPTASTGTSEAGEDDGDKADAGSGSAVEKDSDDDASRRKS
ncbi:DUF3558 domain-containing protein [Streptomyces sp. CRN 30]|uniref:DUF3558 domain-containing protein n=1 Tax=Streptomyces sp. CRN 30 TaxID=3075613 RepID=UPI002A7FC82A|nr:DUF3558 domain-containing protein [Streptomyces sp. CRN 30]